jgi:hypothetical protein
VHKHSFRDLVETGKRLIYGYMTLKTLQIDGNTESLVISGIGRLGKGKWNGIKIHVIGF